MHQCFFRATTRAAPPPKALTRNRPLTIVPTREPCSPVCGSPEGSALDDSSLASASEGDADEVLVSAGSTADAVVDGAVDSVSVPVAVGAAEVVGTLLVAELAGNEVASEDDEAEDDAGDDGLTGGVY